MRKSMLLGIALALVVAGGAFAQAFSVDYLDGTVDLKIPKDKAGNQWKALAIGDSVAVDAAPPPAIATPRSRTRSTRRWRR